jgi:hypothetical protein
LVIAASDCIGRYTAREAQKYYKSLDRRTQGELGQGLAPADRAHAPWGSQFPLAQSACVRQASPVGRFCRGAAGPQDPIAQLPDAHVRGYMQGLPSSERAVQMLAAAGSDEKEQ